MHDRRDAIALAILLVLLFAFAVTSASQGGESDEDPRLSTFLSGHFGARALILTMEDLGIPTERVMAPWDLADALSAGRAETQSAGTVGADAVDTVGADTVGADAVGVVTVGADPVGTAGPGAFVVLSAMERPTPTEVSALIAWVEAGGVLLHGLRRGDDPVGTELGLAIRNAAPDTLGLMARVRWESGREAGVTAIPEPHEWTEGLDSVPGFHYVFRAGAAGLEAPGLDVLLRTRAGDPAVVALPRGAGRVVAWSDPYVLANGRLEEGGAALLFARAASASLADGGTLKFDEYHHGYREGGGAMLALRRFLTGTGAGRWLLQVAAAGLALLLLAGHRLGTPIRGVSRERRSPLEHVDAVATAYRKAGARRTARGLLLAGMNRQLHRRMPPPGEPFVPDPTDATPAARRLGSEWDRGVEGDLPALAAAIDQYVKEVRGWR